MGGSPHDDAAEVQAFISARRHWNQGAGLVVPPHLARELRKMGIEDGYTEQKPIPETIHQDKAD